MNLIPYTGQQPAMAQISGVYITLAPDAWEAFAAKVKRWFADWPEVMIVDYGTSDKQGFGFVLMEWHGKPVDELFLAILVEDEAVGDFTLYGREEL